MKTRCFLIIATILLCAMTAATAADFYIAPNGNDSNPGTIDKPWATFTNASEVKNPGDTIYVRAGTYQPAKNTYFYHDGTAAAPITFKAYPNEAVLIDGTNLPANTALIYISSNYLVFQDIELANSKNNGISLDSGPNKTGAAFTTIRNCKIHGSDQAAIAVTGAHDSLIEKCAIYNNVASNNAHPGTSWPATVSAAGSNNITFQNNFIYNNQGEGLSFFLSNGCKAIGNTVHDNFSANMYLDNAKSCIFDGNFIYTQGDTTYYNGTAPATAVLNGNESYNGVDAPNPSSDNKIINNVIVVLNSNYAYLASNFFNKGGGLKNLLFANNTIYRKVTTGSASGFFDVIRFEPGIPTPHENSVFCNNVFMTEIGGRIVGLPNPSTGLSFHHNLYFGGDPGMSLTASDLNADPKFTSAGGFFASGYTPQPTSPVKAVGVALPEVTRDFNAQPRPVNDLGAFSLGSTPVAPPTTVAIKITSAPTITPNPAAAGSPIQLVAPATSAAVGATVVFTWDLGDSTSQTGATISKKYNSPGVYSGTVTASDGSSSASQSFQITVTASDFAGLNTTLRINFSRLNSDSLSISGSVALGNGLTLNGTRALLTIGDFSREVTLNAKGVSSDRSFKLSARAINGVLPSTTAPFTFTVKRASLSGVFAKYGLPSTPGASSFNVPISLNIGGYAFSRNQSVNCIATGTPK